MKFHYYQATLCTIKSSSERVMFKFFKTIFLTEINIFLSRYLTRYSLLNTLFWFSDCGYCDDSLTFEQALLISCSRSQSYTLSRDKLIDCQMAAVGLSTEEMLKILPEGIYIACQNSQKNVTIVGPNKETRTFVEYLQSNGIFARNVDNKSCPFHSKYLKPTVEILARLLTDLLKDPKPRTSKWISTSIPESENPPEWAQYNCMEYYVNNFAQPVLFEQALKYIPKDAIVIEISPHSVLIPLVKRELSSDITLISLANKNINDNEQYFLSAIGK